MQENQQEQEIAQLNIINGKLQDHEMEHNKQLNETLIDTLIGF